MSGVPGEAWLEPRIGFDYASGDDDPTDGEAGGSSTRQIRKPLAWGSTGQLSSTRSTVGIPGSHLLLTASSGVSLGNVARTDTAAAILFTAAIELAEEAV